MQDLSQTLPSQPPFYRFKPAARSPPTPADQEVPEVSA